MAHVPQEKPGKITRRGHTALAWCCKL